MMKHEFETLAGYEVSWSDYTEIIEPMYNSTNLDKSEFVKVIDRKRFEIKKEKTEEQIALEKRINEEIETLKSDITFYENRIEMFKNFLDDNDADFWNNEIKKLKYEIKLNKNRIAALKWVLA